jgi:hypothetical protein
MIIRSALDSSDKVNYYLNFARTSCYKAENHLDFLL